MAVVPSQAEKCIGSEPAKIAWRETVVSVGIQANAAPSDTFASSSANLGATGVQGLSAKLEEAIKEGRDAVTIGRLAHTLEIGLQELVAGIRTALPQEAATPYAGEVDWTVVRQVLAELEPLLAAGSMQANRVIETHSALLKAALGALGAELEQRIEHFLYPEALETMKRARQERKELAG